MTVYECEAEIWSP